MMLKIDSEDSPHAPSSWALWQRGLIRQMNEAAPVFQERYTRADGTYIWREDWPGMDGSDDGYESYHNWPLFYALGGSEDLHERSRFLWNAVTRQFAAYGQVYREFDAYYDWMHHGESSIYFYYFGLADPHREPDRSRALRFAGMYIGEDPEARNWEEQHRMIRSPITGSRGPRFENSWDDWSTHRWVLSRYPAPFEDIPGVEGPVADWTDDRVYGEILRLLNRRQMRCDVPLNLTATSLVTHAYMHTGDEKYRDWVLRYLQAWSDRIRRNDGICPDNVGPSGEIGETMDGKWWGGYYGWRWPHGLMNILQPLVIAAANALLLTGDAAYLEIPRSQIQRMLELGRDEDGRRLVPHRHVNAGWSDFRPLAPELLLHLWYLSQSEEDRRLVEAARVGHDWTTIRPGRGKGDDIHFGPWYCYLHGELPSYPEGILASQWRESARRMQLVRNDRADPETVDVHHWQDRNPVHTEALLQLACGAPQIVYHGGLLHARLRWFDHLARRPGLPGDVAALVTGLFPDGVELTVENTGLTETREAVLQAGAFGEHRFTDVAVRRGGANGKVSADAAGSRLHLALKPASALTLRIGMQRHVNRPTYAEPW